MKTRSMGAFKDLIVYRKSFDLAVDIHNRTKRFSKEEQYALTDQIRRSARSVCINMGEGFRKLRYRAHFVAKITDADMENSETQIWLDFSFVFGYITEDEHLDLYRKSSEVGRRLNHMIDNPDKYGAK